MLDKLSKKTILLATFGTLIEWAEYTFYGYLAVKLAGLFFAPSLENPNLALIQTLGMFAIGYLMRPIGGIIFGIIGDKYGRKPALAWSLILMGIATFGIGILPEYKAIGIWAPIFLLILRMLQGLAVSGEYHGAAIYLIEQYGKKNPCYIASLVPCFAALGMVVGGSAALLVNILDNIEYTWRIPFILGGLSCVIGFIARSMLNESSEFLNARNNQKIPNSQSKQNLSQLLIKYYPNILLTMAIGGFIGVLVYIGNVYFTIFLHKEIELTKTTSSLFAVLGQVIVSIGIPISGIIADKVGANKQFRWGLVAASIWLPVMFYLALTKNINLIALSVLGYGLINAWVCGPFMYILYKLFPTKLRFSSITISWSLSVALFAGTAPMVAEILVSRFGALMPGLYASGWAIIALAIFKWHSKLNKMPIYQAI